MLGSKAGAANELVAKLLAAYAVEPDAVEVDVLLLGPGQQEQALRDGRADVAILHAPWDDVAGFDTEVLVVEDPAVLVQAGHPLTARDAVDLTELPEAVGVPAPRWPDREGRYAEGPGPEVHDVTQLLQLIALGRTYLVAPVSAATLAGEGVVAVPVTGAPPVTTLLAWPPQSRSVALARFVRVATLR
ncbi:LysR substrate-binding domain-containing protein [Nocardioides sp. CFH 31398]|nr:LysR substrate-binding domain-containing protein [Nocardioides sp. CFH 31398]